MKATLCKTNKGNGYKLVVGNKWLYISEKFFVEFTENKRKSITFNEFQQKN